MSHYVVTAAQIPSGKHKSFIHYLVSHTYSYPGYINKV